MLVTKTELARVLNRDVRSLKLPQPVDHLVTGGKLVALYRHPHADEIAATIAINLGIQHPNKSKVEL